MKYIYYSMSFFLMFFSFFVSASEYDKITKMLIEYPVANVITSTGKGFEGPIFEVDESGYKLLVENEIEYLYLLPKSYHQFSKTGFLENMTSNFSGYKENNWIFKSDRLTKFKSARESTDGRNGRSVVIDFKYDDNKKLIKVISKSKVRGVVEERDGCNDIIIKANSIYSRYCGGGQSQIYTFNDDQRIVTIEKFKHKYNSSIIPFNKNIKTRFIYDEGRLFETTILHDDVKISSNFIEYDTSGSIVLSRMKQFSNNEVLSENVTEYDQYGNKTSQKMQRVKSSNYNPVLGEFKAKEATKAYHEQDNDKYGNPVSLVSTYYKIESDQSATLLKKEFKYFTYKYYESKKSE